MVKMNKETEYEKELNELKKQILKEGDTLLTKRDLLERFCEIDKEYNGKPWNLLQILANINILIGEKPCECSLKMTDVFEIMGNLMSIPYDFDRVITEKDVSEAMDKIRALPTVTPKQKVGHWIHRNSFLLQYKCSECGWESEFEKYNYCPNCGLHMIEPQESEDKE